jgi:succinate dehydrogenase / fumarate reductase iron-sulfur subunit
MRYTLRIWRQASPQAKGKLESYEVDGVQPDMSLLEMLDHLNEQLTRDGAVPVAFDSDCREGICGTCGLVIDGVAHGKKLLATTCELRMREFPEGSTITIEPWRAGPFPIVKDLVVDRSAFDRIIAAGGYISTNTGSAPDGNALLIGKDQADAAMDAAVCIGCAACVAACPNGSASLFTGAKIAQLALLPQGEPERGRRARRMVDQMDTEGFGDCSNHGECEAVCPKGISITHIGVMRREFARSLLLRDQ